MAKINFPNPASEQTYEAGGITWTWNDSLKVWSTEAGGGTVADGASVSVGETPPSPATEGDLWWNSSADNGRMYVYYDGQWVESSPQGGGSSDTDGITEEVADARYLSKTSDDTAAGAITFESKTSHEAGISVTGNQLRVDPSGSGEDKGIVSTINGAYTQSHSCFWAKAEQGTSNTNQVRGYYASAALTTAVADAPAAHGFQSNIPFKADKNNYNFYASGDAPSYYRGDATYAEDPNYNAGWSGNDIGVSISSSNGQVNIARGGTAAMSNFGLVIKRMDPSSTGSYGAIRLGNYDRSAEGRIKISGTTYRTIDTRLGATGVAMSDGAADIVKLLQPKVITQGSDTFAGFLPTDLAGTYAEAMEGDAGATVAIGTYTNPDGLVETEVEEPEAIPYGATWQQTGTQDVMQSVCRENLIPLLTKALQEVIAKNEDLEQRLATLEGGTN